MDDDFWDAISDLLISADRCGHYCALQSSGPARFVSWSRLSATETDNKLSTLDTLVIKPATSVAKIISDFFTSRPISSLIYNFMRGMSLHWDYNMRSGFVAERGQNNFADQNMCSCCITDFASHIISHSVFIYFYYMQCSAIRLWNVWFWIFVWACVSICLS